MKISEKEIIKLQKKVQDNNEIKINKAFELCLKSNQPVHLNIPMEEPLYNFINHADIVLSARKKLKPVTAKKSSFEKLSSAVSLSSESYSATAKIIFFLYLQKQIY